MLNGHQMEAGDCYCFGVRLQMRTGHCYCFGVGWCIHQGNIRSNPDFPRLGASHRRDGGGLSVRTAGAGACPEGRGHGDRGCGALPVPCMTVGYRYPPISMVLPTPPHGSHPHLLAVVGLAMGKIPPLEIFLEKVNERTHYHSLAPSLMRSLCHKM